MQISRVNRSKAEARRMYNRLSSFYDLLSGGSEAAFIQLGLDMLEVKSGETVLEIGSGTGKVLLKLASRVGSSGCVVGIDLSSGMLHRAQARIEHTGASRVVKLVEGDGCYLPSPRGSFSAVYTSFTLELFDTPEIPLVLAEIWRVLNSGGRLGVVCMLKTDHPSRMVRLYEWLHGTFPSLADCRPIDVRPMIESAGFRIESIRERSMWGLPVELVVAKKT